MPKRQVKTSREHIQSLAKATPVQAVEELIWNGLDAGGPMVEVRFGWAALGGGKIGALNLVEVVDSGTGIRLDELDQAFGEIGHSKKPQQRVNMDGRSLHGSEGKGRLRALALSRQPEWITTYKNDGALRRYTIRINRDDPDYFDVSPEEMIAAGHTGTAVRLA